MIKRDNVQRQLSEPSVPDIITSQHALHRLLAEAVHFKTVLRKEKNLGSFLPLYVLTSAAITTFLNSLQNVVFCCESSRGVLDSRCRRALTSPCLL